MESEGSRQPSPDKSTIRVEAVASEMTADGRVRLRLEDGGERFLPPPNEMSEFLRPGLRVVLYYAPNGELLGWFLPDYEVGQDLRQ